LKYAYLGRSGLRVSAVTLGTLPFGGHQFARVGKVTTEDARRMLDVALDAGVNLVDTADVYGNGRAEEVLGEIVRGRRDRVLIATKCRARVGPGPNDEGSSREHIIKSVEGSLKRLGTDYIDLYQLHGWDERTPIEETVDVLDELISEGKVRYVGCSNFSAWQVMKALGSAEVRARQRFVSQQIYYSILGREVEHELIPLSIDQGLGVLVWSPLAGGLLTGQHLRGEDGGEATLASWSEPPVPDPSFVYDVLDTLLDVADALDATVAQVSLAYVLSKPAVTSVIAGPRTVEELVDTLRAVELRLDDGQLARLDAVSAKPLPYPYWHQVQNGWAQHLAAPDSLPASTTDRR
jgi:aryl-alcohol dehydrogenase-like predicted oxidoreductase